MIALVIKKPGVDSKYSNCDKTAYAYHLFEFISRSNGGWLVKNEKVLQSEALENYSSEERNLKKKGSFLVEKTLLTCANLKCRYNGEHF